MNDTFVTAAKEVFGDKFKAGAEADKEAHSSLFNRGCSNAPGAIVSCANVADVQKAVRLAVEHGVPLSVLGGGSHWAGFAIAECAFVLDLRLMNWVRIDLERKTVIFGGGAHVNDVLLKLPDDMVSVTGAVSRVGYTGLTLGGGYGPLNSRFGLACDTVRSAEIVLADGSVAVATSQTNPDLLWALRGGGGNYGVVTALELDLFQVPEVQTAIVAAPLESAATVLALVQAVVEKAPDELSVLSGLVTLPNGERGVFVQPLLSAHSDLGEKLFDELCSQAGAHVVGRRWTPYNGIFSRDAEKAWYVNKHYHVSDRLCQALSAEVIDIVCRAAENAPTPGSSILMHDFHGKASRIPLESAAYPLRTAHYVIEPIAGWDSEEDGARAEEWIANLLKELEPHALSGGWANVLGPDEKQRAHDFYRPSREKLQAVKNKFDPDNVFFSNILQP